MKKVYCFAMILSLPLLLALSACDGGGSSEKSADPYPIAIATDIDLWSSQKYEAADYDAFVLYLADITGVSDDDDDMPEIAKSALAAYAAYGDLLVSTVEYKLVSDVFFYDYTNSWYEPNSTLSITLSNINEESVTETLSTSVGVSLGPGASAFTASVTMESSKTVTTTKGIDVATTYDLTQYDQDKLYKVILMGNYVFVRYHFRLEGVDQSLILNPEWNTDGDGYIGYIDGIKVRQDSLAVKLVHD